MGVSGRGVSNRERSRRVRRGRGDSSGGVRLGSGSAVSRFSVGGAQGNNNCFSARVSVCRSGSSVVRQGLSRRGGQVGIVGNLVFRVGGGRMKFFG